MHNTLAAVERAARIVKRFPAPADKYPVSRRVSRRSLAALASVAVVFALPATAQATPVTEFSTGLTVANAPADITTGPDGNLWFTEQGLLPGIGRITATGDIVTYPAPNGAGLAGLDVDADGNLWFGEADKGKLGRMAIDGTVTEFDADLSGDEQLKDVAIGP